MLIYIVYEHICLLARVTHCLLGAPDLQESPDLPESPVSPETSVSPGSPESPDAPESLVSPESSGSSILMQILHSLLRSRVYPCIFVNVCIYLNACPNGKAY